MRLFNLRWLLFLLLPACLSLAAALPFSDELDAERYDCTLTVSCTPEATGAVELSLEGGAVQVALRRDGVLVRQQRKVRAQAVFSIVPDRPHTLTVLRREALLAVQFDNAIVLRDTVPHGAGSTGALNASPGWTVAVPRVQRLEPVVFADNFMRTADEKGPWQARGGTWALQSAWDQDPKGGYLRFATVNYALNPFAWVGRGGDSPAVCLAGEPFWEDYTCTVAVRPTGRAAGVLVNVADADHALLLRWSAGSDENCLALYQLDGTTRTLLAEAPGGFLPGQWYRLSVTSSLDGIRATIDGREVLSVPRATPWRGGVGLYSEGETTFDDVTVYGRGLKQDLILEQQANQVSTRFREDHKGMAEWATADGDWLPCPAAPDLRVHRLDCYGDHWLAVTVAPTGSGTLELYLKSSGAAPDGYRATIVNGTTATYTLTRNGAVLAKANGPALPNEDCRFRFRREGGRLLLERNGTVVLQATDKAPLPGLRAAYRIVGGMGAVQDLLLLGRNLRDYTFADAPVDWLAEGAWMPTTRWSCSPRWSFLGGWSRGDAVLWHKARFTGDQYVEAWLAPKMEYPRERQTYEYHYRDFGLTICGDGHHPRSGYTLIYGAPDSFGLMNQRTVLLRNGIEVASRPRGMKSHREGGHTAWYPVSLRKRGAVIEAVAGRDIVLSYTDPAPLDGGVPAVWTTDNGVAVARVRLVHANPPQPRTDPQVALDSPWSPEWVEAGAPLTLDFPRAFATSGKPLALTVTTRQAPAGEAAPVVAGHAVTLTPTQTGEHWYEVRAGDGTTQSPAYHAAFTVFNPTLGRDDSHALVLYRFDEGSGAVIHDRAPLGPPADLTIPERSAARWLPGQGLTLREANYITTASNVPKLMAIKARNACTAEFWIAPDTVYPPSEWMGYLLAWEKPNDPAHNFAVGHISTHPLLIPNGTVFVPQINGYSLLKQGACLWNGLRTGLQHLVFTWDGRVTRCYLNGVKKEERYDRWTTEGWTPDAPLILGNQLNLQPRDTARYLHFLGVADYILIGQGDGRHAFLGTFYLAALHDRAFTDADVQRHYQAGPGAK